MMKPEIKQKWIDALATYKQGRGYLRNQYDEFCGLGVLCDIYSKETDVEWMPSYDYIEGGMTSLPKELMEWMPSYDYFVGMEIEGSMTILPKKIMEWAGLDSHNPMVKIKDKGDVSQLIVTRLTVVNDELNYTFSQIAELIKEQL